MTESLDELTNTNKVLIKELELAEAREFAKIKIEKFQRAKRKNSEIKKAQEILHTMKVIEDEDYEMLETLHNKSIQLEASLKAGKLALTFSAKTVTRLKSQKDLEEETNHELRKGDR